MSTAPSHPLPPGTLVRITDADAIGLPTEFQGHEVAIKAHGLSTDVYMFWRAWGDIDGPWYISADEFEVVRLPEEAANA